MKNNNDQMIHNSRRQTNEKAMEIIAAELQQDPLFATVRKPRRRKFPRYAKRIMNDPFIMNA